MPIYKIEGARKDGLQAYRVVVSYTTPDGKHAKKERRAYGLSEAKITETIISKEIKEQGLPKNMTLNDLAAERIRSVTGENRETSIDKSARRLQLHVLPLLGNKKLKSINKTLCQEWKNQMRQKDFTTSYLNGVYADFNALLNYAIKMDYIVKNPLQAVGRFKDPLAIPSNDNLHYYTPDEFYRYMLAAGQHNQTIKDWGYYVFFAISYYCGLRKGESNALKWSDLEGDRLHIRRSVAQKIKGKQCVETPPKNKSSYRTLQVPVPLLDLLQKHKSRQQQLSGFSEDWRICGGPSILGDSSLNNKNALFAKEADLHHIRIHDFRHSHASLLANEGINIQEIARRLGHSNVQTTWSTYAHLYPREEERAIKILNAINCNGL